MDPRITRTNGGPSLRPHAQIMKKTLAYIKAASNYTYIQMRNIAESGQSGEKSKFQITLRFRVVRMFTDYLSQF